MRSGSRSRTWRQYDRRQRGMIQAQVARGATPSCPSCGGPLEANLGTRLRAVLPAGADGYDLDCRTCRRFQPRVRHTTGSLYLLRMRRLAAAVLRS